MKGDAGRKEDIKDCNICNVNTLPSIALAFSTGTHQAAGTCSYWQLYGKPRRREDVLSRKTTARSYFRGARNLASCAQASQDIEVVTK